VTIEGMRRTEARRIHTALVAIASANASTRVWYSSCGFEEVDRAHHYTKGTSR
jgi:L-amino acid N-acyltransferase YncA